MTIAGGAHMWIWEYPGHIAKEGPVEEVGMHGAFAGQKTLIWWKRRGNCIGHEKKRSKFGTQLEKLGKYEDGRDS